MNIIKRKLIEWKIARFNKECERMKAIQVTRVAEAHTEVRRAICRGCNIGDDDFHVLNNSLARVNQETGELVDFLMYFEDYNDIAIIVRTLEAYLTTNREYLNECRINDLERIIKYLA